MIVTDEHMNVIGLLLTDPKTGQSCLVKSNIEIQEDGSYSFVVENPNNGSKWKHTIKTEEL